MDSVRPDNEFECLAAAPEFARFSELLAKLTGVAMSLFSPQGEYRVGYGDGMKNPLCRIIRSSAAGEKRCHACDWRHHRKAGAQKKAILYKCHAGLFDMIIPIFVEDRHVASLSSGQILAESPNETAFARMRKRLAWLDGDAVKMCRAYFSAVYMPKAKVKYMMLLLETFAVQLCGSLHKIRELESRLERPEIRRAKAYVAEHFSDAELGLSETAAHAGLSAAHFSHVFAAVAGTPFTRYVQRVRIDCAKRLLLASESSVSEICFACGFNNLPHFIRVFKNLEDTTPSRFRRSETGARARGPRARPSRERPVADSRSTSRAQASRSETHGRDVR